MGNKLEYRGDEEDFRVVGFFMGFRRKGIRVWGFYLVFFGDNGFLGMYIELCFMIVVL